MTLEQWVILAVGGAFFGLVGQAIRTAMGLRKLHQSIGDGQVDFDKAFSVKRLGLSLLLGMLAGLMAAFSMMGVASSEAAIAYQSGGKLPAAIITSILAAGYAGGDFLEGIVKAQFKLAG